MLLTPRRVAFWLLLLPITIGVWVLVLAQNPLPKPTDKPAYPEAFEAPAVQRVHICSYGGPCWWHPSPPETPVLTTLPPVRPTSDYTVCGIAGAENCWVAKAR